MSDSTSLVSTAKSANTAKNVKTVKTANTAKTAKSDKTSKNDKTSKTKNRLSNYIDLFFGERNGHNLEPKNGHNFTEETLTYMNSRARADEITDIISTYMNNGNGNGNGNLRKFIIVESCAGMGGNTFSFLESPLVAKVVSHEIDDDRRKMLLNSLQGYHFEPNRYDVVDHEKTGGQFVGIPNDVREKGIPIVLHMDPPWLPSDIAGDKSEKEQYILEGIKLGDKTLEEWLNECYECYECELITTRVPPGYVLNANDDKFLTKSRLLKNSLLYFCTPIKRSGEYKVEDKVEYKVEDKEKRILEKSKDIDSKENVSKEKVTVNNFTTPKKPVQKMASTTASTTASGRIPPGVKLYLESPQVWEQALKDFLVNEMLPLASPSSPDLYEVLTTPEAMKIWKKSFTHKSWDRNKENNYELLEKLGDKVMGLTFNDYIIRIRPNVTEGELTKLDHFYMAKADQGRAGRELGLAKFILLRYGLTLSDTEDTLESYFGALFKVGKIILGSGPAYQLTENTLINIYGKIISPTNFEEVTKEIVLGDPKTQIKEIFEGFGWISKGKGIIKDKSMSINKGKGGLGAIEIGSNDTDKDSSGRYTITLQFTPLAIQQLTQMLGQSPPQYFAQSDATPDLGSADRQVYERGLDALKAMNITKELSNTTKKLMKQVEGKLAPYFTAATVRRDQEGLTELYFSKPHQTAYSKDIQLLGKDANDIIHILVTFNGHPSDKIDDIKAKALNKYTSSGRDTNLTY